jgi:hypothetical protein
MVGSFSRPVYLWRSRHGHICMSVNPKQHKGCGQCARAAHCSMCRPLLSSGNCPRSNRHAGSQSGESRSSSGVEPTTVMRMAGGRGGLEPRRTDQFCRHAVRKPAAQLREGCKLLEEPRVARAQLTLRRTHRLPRTRDVLDTLVDCAVRLAACTLEAYALLLKVERRIFHAVARLRRGRGRRHTECEGGGRRVGEREDGGEGEGEGEGEGGSSGLTCASCSSSSSVRVASRSDVMALSPSSSSCRSSNPRTVCASCVLAAASLVPAHSSAIFGIGGEKRCQYLVSTSTAELRARTRSATRASSTALSASSQPPCNAPCSTRAASSVASLSGGVVAKLATYASTAASASPTDRPSQCICHAST